ncbi:AAA family ATPase [Chitinophaga filiformis]|uniref:ATP-binding protein n=1 Tax=Chitinophaga filiformis TaxID=104663 RepID=A0ABY4HW84_CHIFI|nr:ATP-binding protein [Chitinophaga filiformis]UPK67253.1 ATP-binding protein [Chitinophaga filiformis]
MVIITTGLPGSGKSYFAERLAKAIDAEYVNTDRLRKTMLSTRTYSTQEKQAVYDEMLRKMQRAIQEKRDIVLDGTFYKKDIRRKFIQEAKDGLIFIEVQAPEALIQERLQQTRADSEADYKVYQIVKAQWEPLEEEHLVLQSTDKNITGMLQTAIDYLHPKDDKK